MVDVELTTSEKRRLQALEQHHILDSLPEKEYDAIVELASYICGTKKALISFVDQDRQWFKAKIGYQISETQRQISFCSHAIKHPTNIMEVHDARQDRRFQDNPLVTDQLDPIIYYAGVPLVDTEKQALGTLCVLDNVPHKLSEQQFNALRHLGTQVERLLELRAAQEKLEHSNSLLRQFTATVSHDMKMPLASIVLTCDIIRKQYLTLFDREGRRYLSYLKDSAMSLSSYVTNLLEHYESDAIEYTSGTYDIREIIEESIDMLSITEDVNFSFPESECPVPCSKPALVQVFVNLLGNAVKYNDKSKMFIDIECQHKDDVVVLTIRDNGMGIPKDKLESIYDLFSVANTKDRYGQRGHGIGLSTVRKLIEQMNGRIRVESEEGQWTEFVIQLPQECGN